MAPNTLFDALFAPHMDSAAPFLEWRGRRIGYAKFLRLAARAANAYAAAGLDAGDRVIVQAGKSPTALALYAGAVQAGVVYLPLNPAYTAGEVAHFREDSGARLLICDPASEQVLAGGCPVLTLAADGDSGSFLELMSTQEDVAAVAERGPDDLAALLYTSGTTGRSKGAMLTHRNLLSNAETLRDLWRFSAADRLIHALPIFHTHGLFVATNITLLAGGNMILLPKFDADAVVDALPRATAMMGVPTFYTRLLDDDRLDRALAADMRLFISGSAPLLAETHDRFTARTGHRILERYGMTETNMSTSNPYDGDRRAGTVGLPLPDVELKIRHPETGADLPPGEIGIIEVRGPNVFQGYWNMPGKTAEELRPDGFFITGDLAVQGADGYVTIVGRARDLIISGGLNVYPKEVEEAIDALPGVVESAVIGVPHADMGEAVVAAVVGDVTPEAVMAGLTGLARYKQPRHVEIVPELPRNTMGKVQKAALREAHARLFAG
ncbi:MAG: AMP-binding protein [Alphaproteobacteria bacterium]|nr:AMP-binding protein [Alphaproteobacteria bacterium]